MEKNNYFNSKKLFQRYNQKTEHAIKKSLEYIKG